MADERETQGGDPKADAAEIARWRKDKDYVPVLSTQEARDYFYAVRQGASEEEAQRYVKMGIAERRNESAAPRFIVHSMVRRQKTRTTRAKSPTRHRFKQYLFHDPNKRLVRNRPLTISEEELNTNIAHLRERHAQGLIEVRTPDGRIIDLHSMEAGPGRVQSPDPNFPLDSVANDRPAGIDYPQFFGGAGQRDPAAERAAERIAAAKRLDDELGIEDQASPALPPADPSTAPSVDGEAVITTSVENPEPVAPEDLSAVGDDFEDPAASRAASEEVPQAQGEEHGDQDNQEQPEEAPAASVAGDEGSAGEEEQQPTEEVTRKHGSKKKGSRK